jgi:hypothetical protein
MKASASELGRAGLIRLQPVTELVRTAIWTGRLADEKPVSLMLIASQESAKTAALMMFAESPTVRYFSDITTKGLEVLKGQIQDGMIRHIIALDLIRIVSHGRFVSDRTIQALAGLMEEGQATSIDAGGADVWKGMPNVGLLAGVTPTFYHSRRGHWRATGFLTRFLPVHFHYSEYTRLIIHERIAEGLKPPVKAPQILPKESVTISISPKRAEQIAQWAVQWGVQNETYGFRHHRQLRALAKARAFMAGRDTVTDTDLKELAQWSKFFSTHQPALI